MKENPFKAAINSRQQPLDTEEVESPPMAPAPAPAAPTPATEQTKNGRGRPATGKRSNDEWISRTVYVKRSTDYDIEEQLLALKREGVNLDKSDLVDALLAAWVNSRKSGQAKIQIDRILPMQK